MIHGVDSKPAVTIAASICAKPFLKWAGGKGQLLSEFARFYPREVDGYMEPFVGGGAVYFDVAEKLQPEKRVLLDNNDELINCYLVVKDQVDALIERLLIHRASHSRNHYYAVRALDPAELSPVDRAARLIYLNKTCYNGLYRVNSRGRFNVPLGSYKAPRIFEEAQLRAASAALEGAEICCLDFRRSPEMAKPGWFVYLDPPYYPISPTSSFTGYTKDSFSERDQVELAEVVRELDRMGCLVMVSNSDCQFIRSLYAGFRLHTVHARRPVNSIAERRGAVAELVITNYDPMGRDR